MQLTATQQLEIFNMITQADQLATARQAEAYVNLFSDDGKIAGIKGTVTGKSNLISFTQATWQKEPTHSQHLTIAPLIMTVTDKTVVAQSTLLIVDPDTKTIVDCQTIQHTLKQTGKQWLFELRKVL